jgi:hypothetical protein
MLPRNSRQFAAFRMNVSRVVPFTEKQRGGRTGAPVAIAALE